MSCPHLPFQVQAFRAGAWALLSTHHSQEAAARKLKAARRSEPTVSADQFRIIDRLNPRFIYR
jgi:hypothetical protein